MMTTDNQMQIHKDLQNKKIRITRLFAAPVEHVWRAWTESSLLDQWWAPRPWRAETRSMDFRVGGHWLYVMVGPDQSRQWCKVEYTEISEYKSFRVLNMFSDEHGNRNTDFPIMDWRNEFQPTATGTKVIMEITFDMVADLEKIIEMGFEQGFTSALGNLDELLAAG